MANAEEDAGSEFAAATAAFEKSLGCPESDEVPPESFFDCEPGAEATAPAAES